MEGLVETALDAGLPTDEQMLEILKSMPSNWKIGDEIQVPNLIASQEVAVDRDEEDPIKEGKGNNQQ
jgi:hypothetical protein